SLSGSRARVPHRRNSMGTVEFHPYRLECIKASPDKRWELVMHKIAFALAVAAIATASPTLSASAIQGAGGVGHGKGDAGHSRFERRAWGVPPWYGNSCYSRVRTPLGWRKRWVCY